MSIAFVRFGWILLLMTASAMVGLDWCGMLLVTHLLENDLNVYRLLSHDVKCCELCLSY